MSLHRLKSIADSSTIGTAPQFPIMAHCCAARQLFAGSTGSGLVEIGTNFSKRQLLPFCKIEFRQVVNTSETKFLWLPFYLGCTY